MSLDCKRKSGHQKKKKTRKKRNRSMILNVGLGLLLYKLFSLSIPKNYKNVIFTLIFKIILCILIIVNNNNHIIVIININPQSLIIMY